MKLINERRTPMHVLILVVMEEGQRLFKYLVTRPYWNVLILVVMEEGQRLTDENGVSSTFTVLILVVMEEGQRPFCRVYDVPIDTS